MSHERALGAMKGYNGKPGTGARTTWTGLTITEYDRTRFLSNRSFLSGLWHAKLTLYSLAVFPSGRVAQLAEQLTLNQ
jgi:hypothetical protein